MTDADDSKPALINRQSLVPLGAALGVAVVVVGGMLSLSSRLIHIEHAIGGNTRSIGNLREEVLVGFGEMRAATEDRIFRAEVRGWIELLRLANKDKDVIWPDLPGN